MVIGSNVVCDIMRCIKKSGKLSQILSVDDCTYMCTYICSYLYKVKMGIEPN